MFPVMDTDDEGQEWECHTDFRQWVRVEALMLDKDIPENLKTDIALKIIFPVVPNDKSNKGNFILYLTFLNAVLLILNPKSLQKAKNKRILLMLIMAIFMLHF